jgi:AcrR family transcriptional regulator
VARTQAERREETRRRLLEAASDLFAQRGVAGASVDALAEEADRTSGAIYNHFGDKEGLLLALLDEWRDATAETITADFEADAGVEDRLSSLWRNFVAPTSDPDGMWVLLEHELWLYTCRNPDPSRRVAQRYQRARTSLAQALRPQDSGALGTLLVGLLIGLEMQRRLDPDVVPDHLAVAGLKALAESVESPVKDAKDYPEEST